ncbi:MAG: MlaD family protein [Candidatus Gastranaerophilales bacterium]|nr:MlaD family protein [Candidatus Gastranaerophilales bacterium]
MKFSSSFKVGILALSAIIILLFTILWVKGKAISNAERITVSFKDVNGMRPGSGVQMMGVRIGQVEDIKPQINSAESYVDVKFVITEQNVEIPKASEISIQQSGIIGEQFLEITPPREKVIYIPESDKSMILHADDKVQMKLDNKYYDIGTIKKIEIVETNMLPILIKENIKTRNAYKIKYIIDLPGLVTPGEIEGKIVKDDNAKKLRLVPKDDVEIPYPNTNSPYTIIEPMRITDFLALQYRSAESLIETNERIALLLSDDVIKDLQQSAINVNELTDNANITIAKAQELIDLSKVELEMLSENANNLSDKLFELTDNINKIAGDKEFVANVENATKSFLRLSNNISCLMEDPQTKATLANIDIASKNIAELSSYINDMSKDAQLKKYLKDSVVKMNTALDKLTVTLDTVNYATEDEEKLKQTMDDINTTSENLKKFSEKLNKRFLIFRLLF